MNWSSDAPLYPLPAERCKGQPRKGVGDNLGTATVLSHHCLGTSVCFSPFSKGEMLSFFFFSFCVFRCLAPVSLVVFCPFLSS